MAIRGRIQNLTKGSKHITGTIKRIGGGGVVGFEAPLSMADKLSVNTVVEFSAGTKTTQKWEQRPVKITKVIG
ncbi:hypothetical protein KY335_00865 [Candidatus Woesearchaeota archaeon]|nr:hypothetical protein [Candidatus Woesearchaeota archaeon]